MGDRKRYWPSFGRTFVILGLSWLAILWLDPLGFITDARLKSQEIVAKLTAPFYGYKSQAYGQSKIAVVLITDKTLEAEDETFPLPLVKHRHYLEKIVEQAPAAVFVDLAFLGERYGEKLSDLTEPFANSNIPFFFAGGGPDEKMPLELKSHWAITAWEAPEGQYPLFEAEDQRRPTAAMALYQSLCKSEAGCWDRRTRKHFYDQFYDNLVVQWGAVPAPQQFYVSSVPTECHLRGAEKGAVGWMSRFLEALYLAADAIVPGLELDRRQPCFYALTIKAETLDHWNDTGDLRELLNGRVVLYGANVAGVPDLTYSTVHGKVPSVFMHAMALDNLLTYGSHYYHEPRAWQPTLLDLVFGLILILIQSFIGGDAPKGRRADETNEVSRDGFPPVVLLVVLWERGRTDTAVLSRLITVLSKSITVLFRLITALSRSIKVSIDVMRRFFHLVILAVVLLDFALNQIWLHWAVKNWLGSVIFIELGHVVAERFLPLHAKQGETKPHSHEPRKNQSTSEARP
ncbi:MAG TPA: CHASE2 domain-containing protein [Stellaceae bacterium]|nr:CHASE2 domain-containing protein [Stellaceae bacterium]